MKTLAVIPARYSSTRFPGKPLIEINGKTMIQRVYEQAMQVFNYLYVATDDVRIENHIKNLGYNVVMTSVSHKSGTDRCAEALDIIEDMLKIKFDVVFNIQGDEPFILPEQLRQLLFLFNDVNVEIGTLVKKIYSNDELFDPNKPKVVLDKFNNAIYFSRSPIPHLRNVEKDEWIKNHIYYKHIGLYAYKADVLRKITKLLPSKLEIAESLEQLRWIENGFKITVAITDYESFSIDTPEDLQKLSKKE
jgi:3-deoxy-manno-octulosonate cytidylyltransferase (CMP-KDO synthetase)